MQRARCTRRQARNARGIDIIAYNAAGTEFIGVQVKALSKRAPVPLGKSLDKIMGDYWLIINNVAKESNAFVMTPTPRPEARQKRQPLLLAATASLRRAGVPGGVAPHRA